MSQTVTKPRRLFVLTGAGVSAESGLPTFRDPSGLWGRFRPEELATPEAYAANPERVLAFYTARRHALLDPAVAPNAAHLALADLERRGRPELTLVTQNVDDLHERAGSRRVWHLHGELLRSRCSDCGYEYASAADLTLAGVCPACSSRGRLRPAVVWFGEVPLRLDDATDALKRCDLFAAIGTSGQVYPAASFVEVARAAGAHTVEINKEATAASSRFAERLVGPASELVPAYLRSLG